MPTRRSEAFLYPRICMSDPENLQRINPTTAWVTNYVPRTAVNQLEMWQTETWDPDTIDEELSWAADIGLNTARVFLHDILWQQDKEAFLARIEDFLAIASKHGIGVMFVFFDGVWHPTPKRAPNPNR